MATIKITLNELKTIIKNVIKEETDINHENQEVYPAHGYFIPHKYGKISKKYADSLGYNFNNQ